MKYGLSDTQWQEVIAILKAQPKITEAVLFGSRAIDTYREASDVDIAIKGDGVDFMTAAHIKSELEDETYLPFFFDIIAFESIESETLRAHITTKGKLIYRRDALLEDATAPLSASKGSSMGEWTVSKLGYIADVQTGPFGSQLKNEQYITGGSPVVTVEHIENFRIREFSYPSVTEEDKVRLARYVLKSGDIVFTRVGSVDLSAFVKPSQDGWLFSSRMLRVRVTSRDLDSRYVSYFFRQEAFREYVLNISVGATMPSINTKILESIEIRYPPLSEQKAIAEVLSSLDDKIDLLHRQNKTLEALAETLFRHTFIDNAQDDWEVGKLGDEFDFTMGLSPPGTSYNQDKIGMPMFQGNADFGFRFPRNRVFTTEAKRIAKRFDTLISVRAPVGEQNMALEECCIGRGVAAFRYKADGRFYTYTYFKMNSLMDGIKEFNETGTVFGSIGKADFDALEVIIPPKDIVNRFQNEVKDIDDKVIKNCLQIQKLEKLRDTLLPKLMSGEVLVTSDSGALTESAT